QPDGDANGRRGLGTLGGPHQVHAGFDRCSPTLLTIAGDAATDDVLPVLPAALGDRHDMIEGQLAHGKLIAAVLTPMVVPRVDVRTRKRHVVEATLDLDVPEQTNNRGQLEAE